jgi:dipeptidase PepV
MTIDWKKEVELRKDDLMKDLVELLRINSERDDSKRDKEHPFGPGPVKALHQMLGYAERDGFVTKNVDNYVGHIDYGSGDETLGLFAHMDVVPAGSGWDTDPYEPVIKDNKIYARGSSDDKGPTIAAYYGLKIIKDLGLPLSKKIRVVIGTDEESGWGDMDYYFEREEKPDFGFSPDAEFPIINGEKGNVTISAHFEGSNEGDVRLEQFEAGLRVNMVPESASAKLTVLDAAVATQMEKDFVEFVANNPVTGTIEVTGVTVRVEVVGKSAHGASPQLGINGATYLAHFLNQFDFKAGAKVFLQTAGESIHLDTYGKKLGVAHKDEVMGELTMNAGLFHFKADDADFDNSISLNFRYPKGTDDKTIKAGLAKTFGEEVALQQGEHHMLPHYVPVDDPLVATLLAVYEEHTGQKGYETVIGGGTFGRLLDRGVAYGAMFPGFTDTMHQANEFMSLDDLFNAAVIYADAIYRLAK